ncbi:MAG: hypothetical protein WA184_20470 [Stellaceae bacterium]
MTVALSLLGPNDWAALVIGRLIMSWGLFDQRLYAQIILFESEKYMNDPSGDAPTIEKIIEYSFKKRIERLRKLAFELSEADKNTMRKVDEIIPKLKELSQIRHHLAHGYIRIGSAPGQPLAVDVLSHREKWDSQKILTRKVLKEGYKPTHNDSRSSYTLDRLIKAKTQLDHLHDEFSDVFGRIRALAARRREDAQPPQMS